MSVSTDGQISYGILFPEDYEFPWSTDEYEDDIEIWWRDINGYINPIESPYTDDGIHYKPGYLSGDPRVDEPRIDEYWAHLDKWRESNPLPIELVNYQSLECPAYILAVPSSIKTARRGYPEVINGSKPLDSAISSDDRQALIDFCTKHGLEGDAPPCWYLTSYWG